jgi:hypothetical protein
VILAESRRRLVGNLSPHRLGPRVRKQDNVVSNPSRSYSRIGRRWRRGTLGRPMLKLEPPLIGAFTGALIGSAAAMLGALLTRLVAKSDKQSSDAERRRAM